MTPPRKSGTPLADLHTGLAAEAAESMRQARERSKSGIDLIADERERQRCCLRRQGQRCRILVRGAMNSALVEFEDGFRVVTSRNGLRRA